jgi:colicin import membrane protein
MAVSTPIIVPRHRNRWAVPLSVLAHGGLVMALVLSVAWKSEPPAQLQAELWEAIPTPPPSPAVVAQPEPEPVKPPVVKAPEPEPEPEAIAPKTVKKTVQKPEPKVELKPEPEPPKKVPKPQKTTPLAETKPVAKATPKVQAKPDTSARDAARAKEIARMNQLSQSAGLGAAPVVGVPQAGSAQGLGQGWGAKLKACVQPNLRYSEAGGTNPRVELLVKLSATGSPLDVSISKPSGNSAYDSAVERAVRRCDPFPKPESGAYPNSLTVAYRLND